MRTQQLIILTTVSLLAGCSNAVSYHHSERNSIALEGRTTDPQQPVQGVIGVKTRTILVTPKTEDGNDSLSVVSDFKLKREDNTDSWFNTTRVTSAFLTGDAAVHAPATTIAAVSGLGHGAIGDSSVKQVILMESIYQMLTTFTDDEIASNHVKALDHLATKLPPKLNENTYYTINTTAKEFRKNDAAFVVGIADNFIKVIEYSRLLNASITAIDTMIKTRDVQFKDNGTSAVIDEKMLNHFNLEKKRLLQERSDFFEHIGNSAVIDAASQYTLSFL